MEKAKYELDIDVIGDQIPLTPEQIVILTEYFKQRKITRSKLKAKKPVKRIAKAKNLPA